MEGVSAFIRYGCAGVELVAGSPPSESVMSAATMRPLALHGPVKSSSVMTTTFPSGTPAALISPPSGLAALWMKSVCGWATPSGPPSMPPPAIRIGSHGLAFRIVSVRGSRQRPLVA